MTENCESTLDALTLPELLAHARSLFEHGRSRESREAFGRALSLATAGADTVHEAHARIGIARVDALHGEWQRALDGLSAAKLSALRANDQALLHLTMAHESFHGSELHDAEEQLGHLERAAAFFDAAGDVEESLYWKVQLGRAYTDFDRHARALGLLGQAAEDARAHGSKRMEGFALFGLGGAHLSRGELEDARATYVRAVGLLEEAGKERERGYALGYHGAVHHLAGRREEAGTTYRAACASLAAVGDAPNATLFALLLAGLLADEDRTEEAERILAREEANVVAAGGSGMRPVVAELSRGMLEASLARAAFRAGDLDAFVRHQRGAAERLRAVELRPRSVESARIDYDWRDVSLDVRVAFRLAQRAVLHATAISLPEDCVVVRGACMKIRPRANGAWIDLQKRHPLRRIMMCLVGAHRQERGSVVRAAALVAAGWPDAEIAPKAAMNRLHVALGTLRQMGMGALLERHDDGWRLPPRAPVLAIAEDDTAFDR